ncbi:hypothetical protein OG921_24035 [Aldersonia sp. NBC_00410]|uniref:hypothetical protein n=1 Tax=Aldersonia sp. NBC_00410 TaxID=2975954 RepID=UPI0022583F55|nr:hypothetical protein [Aldersonia sp. NBC_00410]MCX5046246.1 hypothetical protein [Aldersonia sp. NBC_00410]
MLFNVPLDVGNELDAALADLSVDELRHFLPKAHGGEMPFTEAMLGEQSWYFQGRGAETRSVAGWLARRERGMRVITGPAGSGKSALLGHLVVHANPTLRTALHAAGVLQLLPSDQKLPDNAFDLILHLTGASTQEVIGRLAHGIGADSPPSREVGPAAHWLAKQFASHAPVTILVDALDEAVDPLSVARTVLRELAAVPTVRLLVGTRASTREQPDRPAPDTDLLDALGAGDDNLVRVDRDPDAIYDYVRDRLRTAASNGEIPASMQVDAFAKAVQARDPQFLFARLAVHEVIANPAWHAPVSWADLLKGNHQHLFGLAVARLAAARASYPMLLAALAFARGRGVPVADDIWATTARAISPTGHITRTDIDQLAAAAAPYVLADREYDQTVYRLAHRTFAEHFTNETEPTQADRDTHLAITQALAATTAGWDHTDPVARPLNPYLTHCVSAHAASAGEIGWRLIGDDQRLLALLDPESVAADALRTAFGRYPLPPAVGGLITSLDGLIGLDIPGRSFVITLATARQAGTYTPPNDRASPDPNARLTLQFADLKPQPAHRILTGHTGTVQALATVPLRDGGVLLASGDYYGTIRLWNPLSGTPHGDPMPGHNGPVRGLAAMPLRDGGTLLASSSGDYHGTIRFWDPVTGAAHGDPLHTGRVSALAAVPLPNGNSLLACAGGYDRAIRLWDPLTGLPHGDPLPGSTGRVVTLAAMQLPDGRVLLAAGDHYGTIRLWDPLTGLPHGDPLPGSTGRVVTLAAIQLPGGGVLLASAGGYGFGGTIRLWDPLTGAPHGDPLQLIHPVNALGAVHLRDEGVLLASAGDHTGSIRLWDPLTNAPHGDLAGPTGPMSALAAVQFRDGGVLLASGGWDGTVRLWDPLSNAPYGKSQTHTGSVVALAAVQRADGGALLAVAAGAGDGTIRLWDSLTGASYRKTLKHTETVWALAAMQLLNGDTLLASGDSRMVQLWDPSTGQPLRVCGGRVRNWFRRRGHDYRGIKSVMALETVQLPDGGVLLASGDGRMVQLWDPLTGAPHGKPLKVTGRTRELTALQLRDGGVLLAIGVEKMVQLWNPLTGAPHGDPLRHTTYVRELAALPLRDGGVLLASGDGPMVQLWDPLTGAPHGDPLRHTSHVRALAAVHFRDGGVLLASGDQEGTVRLWNPDPANGQGTVVAAIPTRSTIRCMSALDDGLLAVGLADGIVVMRFNPTVRCGLPPPPAEARST